ncbi:pancreatic triacylglycerol lipase-like [Lucilia sericata]|uniref:pancreatic triacylglycerol lipase-like n=1 Tax=Lucilia sericata TaxID=13632 RepID=UPI0018A873F7|nr:pancreatic triacylglycerol lipase-like [Lucilia sericata]
MKVLIFLAFGCLTVYASPSLRVSGENGWYIPQENGSFKWIDMHKADSYLKSIRIIKDFKLLTNPVEYYLYTKSNPTSGEIITAEADSINASNFNSSNPTRFVVHGWTQSWLSDMNIRIRDAWLSLGEYNIIIVDWARARSVDYYTSVLAIPGVGEQVANMVDYLASVYSMSLNTLHVIGFSLGSHVAGYCGKNVVTGQIRVIIGLDPSLPLFKYEEPDKRLNNNDAYYVQSIHTNGGQLSFLEAIGRGAFYPNGGESQPGCILDVTGVCSHFRSYIYYAEAVAKNNFGTIQCANYEDAVAKDCGNVFSSVRMGAVSNADMVGGVFYVPVNSQSPYGILS